MSEMQTDAAALAQESVNFARISSDLEAQIVQVVATAAPRLAHPDGQAGLATDAALTRFQEAAAKQKQLHEDISTAARQAGIAFAASGGEAPSPQMGHATMNRSSNRTGNRGQFDAVEAAATTGPGRVQGIDALLDEGKSSLAKLSAVWGGSGSEGYQDVQRRWDATADELNAKLKTLADRSWMRNPPQS